MIKRLLAVDGIEVVCQFRDDGVLVVGYGLLGEPEMVRLAKFAHDYKRIVQGNADQLSMFTQMRGWTPPGGWIVRGSAMTVCSVGNLVCLVRNDGGSLTEVMSELREAAHW
jgi:roadblock/LC7 domain-containing protein